MLANSFRYFALLLVLIGFGVCSGCGQSSRLIRRCPASTQYARVEVSKQGDVTLTPCADRSLTINGVVQPKRYVALVAANGTNPPVATVLENTLGTSVTWARTSAGLYTGTAGSAVFTSGKTVYNSGSVAYDAAIYGIVPTSATAFQFVSLASASGTPVDLSRAVKVSIEVYP